MEQIPIDQLEGLKLADAVFQRDKDDSRVFPNDDKILDLINRVRKEPAVVRSRAAFDVAFVCALHDPELTALIEAFGGEARWTKGPSLGQQHIYKITDFTTLTGESLRVIAGAPTYMGLTATAILATEMILMFQPKFIAMVGIAAGTRSKDQGYGDILVADPSVDYASGKLFSNLDGTETFQPNPFPIPIDTRLRTLILEDARTRAGLSEIVSSWPNSLPEGKLTLHIGTLGTADQVVNSSARVEEVTRNWRKLIGLEMETYALYRAAHEAPHPRPMFVSFKSVCDFATNKTDIWQKYAAFTAAGFSRRFLFNHWDSIAVAPAT